MRHTFVFKRFDNTKKETVTTAANTGTCTSCLSVRHFLLGHAKISLPPTLPLFSLLIYVLWPRERARAIPEQARTRSTPRTKCPSDGLVMAWLLVRWRTILCQTVVCRSLYSRICQTIQDRRLYVRILSQLARCDARIPTAVCMQTTVLVVARHTRSPVAECQTRNPVAVC
jgi:hypothetical protein